MKLNQELQELTSKKELDRQNLVLSLKESKYRLFFKFFSSYNFNNRLSRNL